MKKLVFSALACVTLVTGSFASNLVEIQKSKEEKPEQAVPCKWREVITINGKKYYGDWQRGNCNVIEHQDGTKTYVPIRTGNYLSPTIQ